VRALPVALALALAAPPALADPPAPAPAATSAPAPAPASGTRFEEEGGPTQAPAQDDTRGILRQANGDPGGCNKAAVLSSSWCSFVLQAWQQADADRNRMIGLDVGAAAAFTLAFMARYGKNLSIFDDEGNSATVSIKPQVTITGAKSSMFGLRASW
jgi:hypothetical protein